MQLPLPQGKHQWLVSVVLVAQSCPTLCNPMDYNLPGSSVHGILQARILGYHSLLQGIFLTQRQNLGLPHCRQTLCYLRQPENTQWFSRYLSSQLTQHFVIGVCPIHKRMPFKKFKPFVCFGMFCLIATSSSPVSVHVLSAFMHTGHTRKLVNEIEYLLQTQHLRFLDGITRPPK